jgi:uncharacterized repeat protein (TIGR01451 family)
MTKVCAPDPVALGDDITWTITIENTGEKTIDCVVTDLKDPGLNGPLQIAPLDSDQLIASRAVDETDAPVISNTATAVCETAFDNVINLEASADCEVIVVDEFCRTPGFWGTHAGTSNRRSTDLTQLVIDAAPGDPGGQLNICGEIVNTTALGAPNSALEAMCVSVKGLQQRQLARQLTAAALNCIVSGGGAACEGTSIETLFGEANAACVANDGDLTDFIDDIDAFNNGYECGDEMTSFADFDVFDGVDPLPGPAGSGRDCGAATKNDVYLVQ